jgi:hypothetical protein
MSKKPQSPAQARASRTKKRSYLPDEDWSYYPNDNLAQAIVNAWADPKYKEELLTFGVGKAASWAAYPGQRDAMLLKTSKALEQVDIFLKSPVVLTPEQYPYDAQPDEVVFVLPDMLGKKPSLPTARVAMKMHPCGI